MGKFACLFRVRECLPSKHPALGAWMQGLLRCLCGYGKWLLMIPSSLRLFPQSCPPPPAALPRVVWWLFSERLSSYVWQFWGVYSYLGVGPAGLAGSSEDWVGLSTGAFP